MSNDNDNADGNHVDVGKDVDEYDAPPKHESKRILVANLCLLLSLLDTSSFLSSWSTSLLMHVEQTILFLENYLEVDLTRTNGELIGCDVCVKSKQESALSVQ